MPDPTCPHCSILLSEHPGDHCLSAWVASLRGWTNLIDDPERGWLGTTPFGLPSTRLHRWPNSDLVAAFELVEPGRHFRLTAINDAFNTGEPWEAEMAPQIIQYAPTPAHAITKAYIAAMQEKDGA